MKHGCTQTFTWPRQKARILSHASGCSYLTAMDSEEVQGINATIGEEAPSVKLANMQTKSGGTQVQKKQRVDSESSALSNRTGSSTFKVSHSAQPSVATLSRKAKAEQLTLQLDLDVLKWIVVSGIPPTTVDLPQWKTMWEHAAAIYRPASASKLVDYHLPRECAHVRTIQLERLRHEDNLYITFDGNTTCGQELIYTIHITTADRIVYLFEGNSQSDKSHDAPHLFSVVDRVSA